MPPQSFDLFSERTSDASVHYSSPVQETEKLKEIRLERENKMLLESRAALLKDIETLEREWNELQNYGDEDENENANDEEDELIFDLLVERAEKDKKRKENANVDTAIADGDDEAGLVDFDDSKFTTKPSRNWSLRIEYLKKLYPYLSITNAKSQKALESNPLVLIKTVSFEVNYANIFIFDVALKLHTKQDNVYYIWKLELERKSNNKFNTILSRIRDHFQLTRNINEFLYSVNTLYDLLITRQKTFSQLNEEYNKQKDGTVPTTTIYTSHFTHRSITVNWDVTFREGDLHPLVTVHSAYNGVFADMVNLYGVQRAVQSLIDDIHPRDF